VLVTNGLLLTDRIIQTLNVDEVQVSIDGMEEAHDSLRGPGSFRRAMDALRRCTGAGMDASAATMVTRRNMGDFPAMEETFRGLGLRDWTVDVPCSAGRMSDNPDLAVSPAEGGPLLGYGFGGGFHGGTTGFACGLHLAAVSAGGNVARCTFYADRPAGHISEGLRSCWSKIRPVRLDELTCDCRLAEQCRGGCRYRAETLEGPGGRDLYKCFLHDIMDKE
jgi:radical SAM protein with 4Fe4S-binding SPASM domain